MGDIILAHKDDKGRAFLARPPKTLFLARISVFSALSIVGSFIHPPSPIQTVAFDSLPGFFAALYFGAYEGALVCGIGHVATSIINGLPLGLVHLPISFGMALSGGVMGLINKTNHRWGFIPATTAGIIINTGLFVCVIPPLGLSTAFTFIPFLLLASSLNSVIACLIYLGVWGDR